MSIKGLANKKVYLYGDLKCCKDFAYIFDNVTYADYLYGDKKAVVSELLDDASNFIIVCAFSDQEVKSELEKAGFQYGMNLAVAEDYFDELNYPVQEAAKGKDLYIWGAGNMGKEYAKKFSNVKAFLDSDENKKGTLIEGIRVLHPDDMSEEGWKNAFVLVSSELYYQEIRKILLEKGLIEHKDFVNARFLTASNWMKKTFYDRRYFDFCCESTYRVYEVETNGDVSCCCTTLINGRIGNLLYEDYDTIWRSIFHKIMCLSLCNRTFSFCITTSCPALINRPSAWVTDELIAPVEYKKFIDEPEYLHLSIDGTCNLYCESCREQICVSKGEDLERANTLKEKILNSVKPGLKNILMAGNGEVFLSKVYEDIWKSDMVNNATLIKVQTNGMLLTPKRWEEFYKGKENAKIWLYVSIDAATKETYETIRRGGNFEILKKNMEFAAQLRREGKIQYFRINFVVQRRNYLEMEDFIRWGLELGCDNVFFTKILNWGTFTDEEFKNVSMMENERPKPELAEILDKEIFKNKIVDLGTIQYRKNRTLPDYVDNYYDWETRDWEYRSI